MNGKGGYFLQPQCNLYGTTNTKRLLNSIEKMKSVTLFDPGIKNARNDFSDNIGDLIIQEAVFREIYSIFKDVQIRSISTHEYPDLFQLLSAAQSQYVFVGGTNLLGSKLRSYKQWKVSLRQKILISRAILLGVGWEQYQAKPCMYTRISYRSALSRRYMHSVRDGYTLKQLKEAGIHNVINTGCPTMWPFQDIDSSKTKELKSDMALIMLTDYRKNPDLDRKFLDIITKNYSRIIFWPQGAGDASYLQSLLDTSGDSIPIHMLERSFSSFQKLLASDESFDYIGTRLHGGIKCLLSGRRSLIIEVDNRAKEIGSETNLPTIERDDLEGISQWMKGSSTPKIKINCDSIRLWKSQFMQKK